MNKRAFIVVWIVCILGSLALIPYLYHAGLVASEMSLGLLILNTVIQSGVIFGLVCLLSYLIVPRAELGDVLARRPIKTMVTVGLLGGCIAGFSIVLLGKTLFQGSVLAQVQPPSWAGALASLYGAVNEEVLMRLFCFSLIYYIFLKLVKFEAKNRVWFLWVTNILVALLFGMAHLPAVFKLIDPSNFEIARVLVLNGIAGLIFGYIYWSRGLWTAISAHFVTDIILHVL